MKRFFGNMNLEKLKNLGFEGMIQWRIWKGQACSSYKYMGFGKTACQRNEMEAEKRIKHYSSSHKILLVGEGNFSFAASLATSLGSGVNIVATSLDSKVMLNKKYNKAMANVSRLEDIVCTVIHEVDCCTMSQHPKLMSSLFDRIVFNFPHAGFFFTSESTAYVIGLHKNVVKGFLRNAVEMLTENGEVHITHKTAHPYNMWEIEKLANEVGLGLLDKVPFFYWDYPVYTNKRGEGERCDESFPIGKSSTYKFKIMN